MILSNNSDLQLLSLQVSKNSSETVEQGVSLFWLNALIPGNLRFSGDLKGDEEGEFEGERRFTNCCLFGDKDLDLRLDGGNFGLAIVVSMTGFECTFDGGEGGAVFGLLFDVTISSSRERLIGRFCSKLCDLKRLKWLFMTKLMLV